MKRHLYKFLILFMAMAVLASCKEENEPIPDTPNPNPVDENPPSSSNALLINDPTFKAATGFTSANAAVQPDGKIILDGYYAANGQTVIKILRLNKNGSLDSSFDIDQDKSWIIKNISGIFILADGKVLICGEFTIKGQRAFLARLTTTEALDNSYVQPNIGVPASVNFQRTASGKVLVSTTEKTSSVYNYVAAKLFRLNSDGSLDNGFNVKNYDVPSTSDAFRSIVPLVNGKIIIAGIFSVGDDNMRRQDIARLNADGSVDFSFNFKEKFNYAASISRVTVQSDGKIVISGAFTWITDPNIRDANYYYYGMARLNPDGDIDHSFNAPKAFTYSNYINDITTLSDNRILAHWKSFTNNQAKSYIEFLGNNGGIDNSYVFQFQYSNINSILREAPDQFLLLGEITVDNTVYPIIRLKKP
ncbi:delta-60 repeat domain-containing protein [Rufibacter quisquiliarum]|uniref:Putative delta-60 repeat protein n=1 Tax=Rufibacter quisquiliarum TaxID=1549639 RepID=A0A839GRU8_9BACT|nr:delta-60 repeat domain-containing protein [Rufibacter quisquiliarum]MBA9076561.1 putative delta-60 repeat protein [Rufibacter quisquiliarum]